MPTPPNKGNWGRWGADDERGTANLITAERVRAAAGLVRTGKVYSLALPIRKGGVPVSHRRSPPLHFMTIDGGDYAAGLRRHSGFQSADDYVAFHTHVSTHIDALAHAWYDDVLYNGHPADSVKSGGAERCGIDKLAALTGRGVLIDLCRHQGVDRLEGGAVITRADIESCAEAQGTALGEGDAVLIRTGWLSVFARQGGTAYFAAEPGVGLEAAAWLGDIGIAAIGVDNWGIEPIPTENGETAPVHRLLIRDYGMYLMEMLVLDELARDSVGEFLFVCAPLRISGGVGSPINPLAIA